PGLPEMRQYDHGQRGAGLVPDSIVVAGHDSKLVIARADVTIMGGPLASRLDPLMLQSFEHVLEADLLWRGQAQGRVMELEPWFPGRHAQRNFAPLARRPSGVP